MIGSKVSSGLGLRIPTQEIGVRYSISSTFAGEEIGMERLGSASQGPIADEQCRQDINPARLPPEPLLLTMTHCGFLEMENPN